MKKIRIIKAWAALYPPDNSINFLQNETTKILSVLAVYETKKEALAEDWIRVVKCEIKIKL